MRTFFTLLGFLVFSQVHGQICPAQLESVPLSSWSTTQNTSYVDGDLYLDALNEPQYEGIWTIGTGVSNANLSVAENSSISAFIGVKRRNVVAPSDNIEMVDNVYNIEPGYSPLSQGSSSLSELANWNFLLYANLGEYTFEDVDIRLYMDLDPCYTAQVEDMVEIDVAAQFQNFFGNANFSAFGINQNLASNFVQAFDSENIVPFDPTAEGYYTLAVGIYDVCGNLKLWHEVLVNVSSSEANDADSDGIADDQELGGCDNVLACNYDCAATENDGSCDFSSCSGCTVEEACNFDENASVSDNSGCIYPVDLYGANYLDCTGACLNDADQDGVCDEDEVVGCQDSAACNFNDLATDEGACEFPADLYGVSYKDCDGNCVNDADGDGVCEEEEIQGCTDSSACNFDSSATDDDGSCEFSTCAGCTVENACNYDATATIPSPSTCEYPVDLYGANYFDCTGACLNDADQDGVCDEDEVVGCQDSAACNFNDLATDEGACEFPADLYGVSYKDCDGNCVNDADGDGVCEEEEIQGCTDGSACNFDSSATDDDGSCEFSTCAGCTVENACNFDATATIPSPSTCEYPVDLYGANYFDCTGACLNDADQDGVCDEDEVVGCQDSAACNFNDLATDEGACEFPADLYGVSYKDCDGNCVNDADGDGVCEEEEIQGCTDSSACNFDSSATDDDGSCEFSTCAGCTVENACNYDATATIPSPSTCEYPVDLYGANYFDCTGACLNDADQDGVCDEDEVVGCQDSAACNFNDLATDEGACEFPVDIYGVSNLGCDGTCLNDTDDDGVCDEDEIPGCTDTTSANYNPNATEDDDSCESSTGCMLPWAPNYSVEATVQGLPVFDVCFAVESPVPAGMPAPGTAASGCTDFAACNYAPGGDPALPCDYSCFGCTNPLACDYSEDAVYNTGCTDFTSCVGCLVSSACNYDETASISDGSCEYTSCAGCMNSTACNFDESATISASSTCVFPEVCDTCSGETDGTGSVILGSDIDGDGVCDDAEVSGCTNSQACNFDPTATENDGSCEFTSCVGCLNPSACNYEGDDPTITLSQPIDCIYPEAGLDCDGNCLNDTDGDGVCDEDEILGCTDELACNFDAAATDDDESCSSAEDVFGSAFVDCDGNCLLDEDGDGVCDQAEVSGCTNSQACNFDPTATENDGSCEFTSCAGCLNPSACNYEGDDPTITLSQPIDCIYPEAGLDCDGNCLNDTDGDGVCDEDEILGCTDELACNFDAAATDDDESCSSAEDVFGSAFVDCDGNCLLDEDGDGVCDQAEVSGCTNSQACNFDPTATEDDGSCEFTSCVGCLNPSACNYEGDDPTITLNQPIDCIYPEAGLDCDGNCLNDTDEDGVCDEDEIPGCTDELACNFNAAATDDDGTCFTAEDEFGSAFVDCDGDCLVDEDGDGVCDQEEVFGCDIILSCNYNPAATENDGSCEFESCSGCKDTEACNYDPEAILSDNLLCVYDTNPELVFDAVLELNAPILEWSSGDYLTSSEGAESVDFVDYPGRLEDGRYNVTRIYTATSLCGNTESVGQLLIAGDGQTLGCTNSLATNYSPDAINDDGTCSFDPACLGDLNDDSIVGATDLLMLLSAFGVSCDL